MGSDSEDQLFTKHASSAGEDMRCEAAALRWLGDAMPGGGIRATRVFAVDAGTLTEERVRGTSPSREGARLIGAGLARMHAAGAPWFGCPPDGWAFAWGSGYVLRHSITPVVPCGSAFGTPGASGNVGTPSVASIPGTWGAYYAEFRIRAYARQARDIGTIGSSETRVLERVCSRLERGDFDTPQPALVEQAIASSGASSGTSPSASSGGKVTCARLHGDLWAGNVLYDGGPTGATLIDPLAHGGHAETDLAMLQLFGYPFLNEVLSAYDEVSPLSDGWRERVPLHQLAPLMHHVVLFGGGYVDEAMRAARRYT